MPDGGGLRILGIPELLMEYHSLNLIRQLADLDGIDRRFETVKKIKKNFVRRVDRMWGDGLLVDGFSTAIHDISPCHSRPLSLGPASSHSVSGT